MHYSKRINPNMKLLLFALNYHGGPISFIRLVRLIRLAELSNIAVNEEAFNLEWFQRGKEYRSEDLSKALNQCVKRGLIQYTTTKGIQLCSPVPVSLSTEWEYSLKSYLNSSYIKAHPSRIDKQEQKLMRALERA